MQLDNISIPEVYLQSNDFRTLLKWFQESISKVKYDTENFFDLYDELRCKAELLWMLADTMGFKYDDRLPIAFNRLVLVYFMAMIRLKGSKDGVTLAAETNLAQFNIIEQGIKEPILTNRLEDTSIPVNSVYVEPHTDLGYINVVYFSTKTPINACIEYVRPLGMYLFEFTGVRMDARTKISVDARLTNTNDLGVSIGSTKVGHYSREDYARMQKANDKGEVDQSHTRRDVWYRNSKAEGEPSKEIDPGYRSLYSLQLCNNEQVVSALIDPIFSLGYHPQPEDVSTYQPDNYLNPPYKDKPVYNLRYDKNLNDHLMDISYGDEKIEYNADGSTKPPKSSKPIHTPAITNFDENRVKGPAKSKPRVNPVMAVLGDAMNMDKDNQKYTVTKTYDKKDMKIKDAKDID